jgi:hypothetical protein
MNGTQRQINRINAIPRRSDRRAALEEVIDRTPDNEQAVRVINQIHDGYDRYTGIRRLVDRIIDNAQVGQITRIIHILDDESDVRNFIVQLFNRIPDRTQARSMINRIHNEYYRTTGSQLFGAGDRMRSQLPTSIMRNHKQASGGGGADDRVRSNPQLANRSHKQIYDGGADDRVRSQLRNGTLIRASGGGGAAAPAVSQNGSLVAQIRELGGEEALDRLRDLHPDIFDPITMEVIKDPVKIGTGNSYQKEQIQEWFKTKKQDPISREKIKHNPVPNHTLRKAIITILKSCLRQLRKEKK